MPHPFRAAADRGNERVCTDSVVPAPARPVVAPYGAPSIAGRRARRPRRAVRAAADSTREQICTKLVVPARGTPGTASPTNSIESACTGRLIAARIQNPCEAHRTCSLFSIHNSLFTTAISIAKTPALLAMTAGFARLIRFNPPTVQGFSVSLFTLSCVYGIISPMEQVTLHPFFVTFSKLHCRNTAKEEQ